MTLRLSRGFRSSLPVLALGLILIGLSIRGCSRRCSRIHIGLWILTLIGLSMFLMGCLLQPLLLDSCFGIVLSGRGRGGFSSFGRAYFSCVVIGRPGRSQAIYVLDITITSSSRVDHIAKSVWVNSTLLDILNIILDGCIRIFGFDFLRNSHLCAEFLFSILNTLHDLLVFLIAFIEYILFCHFLGLFRWLK